MYIDAILFLLSLAPTFSCGDIDPLIILRIFTKTWETIIIQYGKRFLMQLLDADDEFSEAATMNRRLEQE